MGTPRHATPPARTRVFAGSAGKCSGVAELIRHSTAWPVTIRSCLLDSAGRLCDTQLLFVAGQRRRLSDWMLYPGYWCWISLTEVKRRLRNRNDKVPRVAISTGFSARSLLATQFSGTPAPAFDSGYLLMDRCMAKSRLHHIYVGSTYHRQHLKFNGLSSRYFHVDHVVLKARFGFSGWSWRAGLRQFSV